MAQPQSGPPYLPQTAQNGGTPSVSVDIPITAVFLVLYIAGAVGHMTFFQLNKKRGHKFLLSGALFGFCMSRILTCSLRIGVVTHQSNASLNIAAQIFLNAGVLIAYVAVLIISQRLLRALQPEIGWSKALSIGVKAMYISLAVSLVLTITFVVITFYTLDTGLRTAAMWVQRASITWILIFNLISLGMYLAAVLLPTPPHAEHFGHGSMTAKKVITGVVLALCILEAGFRAGITWETARPVASPAWYQSKPAFYVFFFGVEILIIYTLLITRFDLRFWIPNGSKQHGDYSRQSDLEFKEEDPEAEMSTTGAK